jgi:hypothetical protein
MKVSQIAKMITASAITKVLSALELGEKMDYNETKTKYEKFWIECQDCFIFEVVTMYSILIEQMIWAPKDWTIWEYKDHGMNETLHY